MQGDRLVQPNKLLCCTFFPFMELCIEGGECMYKQHPHFLGRRSFPSTKLHSRVHVAICELHCWDPLLPGYGGGQDTFLPCAEDRLALNCAEEDVESGKEAIQFNLVKDYT